MKPRKHIAIANLLFTINACAQAVDEAAAGDYGAGGHDAVAAIALPLSDAEQNDGPGTAQADSLAAVNDSAADDDDDDFELTTFDAQGCGVANFVDYGPGAPGGGDNDDYIVIHDYCADGHGVRARVWLNGVSWGSEYNGNGLVGEPVIWDPFKAHNPNGNVLAEDSVVIEVCLVDGANDSTGAYCRKDGFRSGGG